jgi:hypothetical protein
MLQLPCKPVLQDDEAWESGVNEMIRALVYFGIHFKKSKEISHSLFRKEYGKLTMSQMYRECAKSIFFGFDIQLVDMLNIDEIRKMEGGQRQKQLVIDSAQHNVMLHEEIQETFEKSILKQMSDFILGNCSKEDPHNVVGKTMAMKLRGCVKVMFYFGMLWDKDKFSKSHNDLSLATVDRFGNDFATKKTLTAKNDKFEFLFGRLKNAADKLTEVGRHTNKSEKALRRYVSLLFATQVFYTLVEIMQGGNATPSDNYQTLQTYIESSYTNLERQLRKKTTAESPTCLEGTLRQLFILALGLKQMRLPYTSEDIAQVVSSLSGCKKIYNETLRANINLYGEICEKRRTCGWDAITSFILKVACLADPIDTLEKLVTEEIPKCKYTTGDTGDAFEEHEFQGQCVRFFNKFFLKETATVHDGKDTTKLGRNLDEDSDDSDDSDEDPGPLTLEDKMYLDSERLSQTPEGRALQKQIESCLCAEQKDSSREASLEPYNDENESDDDDMPLSVMKARMEDAKKKAAGEAGPSAAEREELEETENERKRKRAAMEAMAILRDETPPPYVDCQRAEEDANRAHSDSDSNYDPLEDSGNCP